MKILLEFLPIVLFFIVYKFAGIYWATAIAVVASVIQFLVQWFKHKKTDTLQLITLICILILGGATLLFHNELFIKWKPTAINWAFGFAFLLSQFIGEKPLIQRLMEHNIELPERIWKRLNFGWVSFFIITGAINLAVAYYFPTNIWVNFKLFGLLGMTLIFILIQSVYLGKYATASQTTKEIE